MTSETVKNILLTFAVAVTLAALPAIYAYAQPESPAAREMGRMTGGCDGMTGEGAKQSGMMGGGMMGRGNTQNGMMGGGMTGGMMGGGMMGQSERPNQQWRR